MPHNIAGIGKRILGGFIDLFLSILLITLLGSVFGGTHIGGAQSGGFYIYVNGPTFVCGSILVVFIFAYLEFKYGKTPGKFIAGTKVVAEETGSPITFKQSMIRNGLRLIDGILLYLVGLVIIAIDKNKQRLGDLAAKTVVVTDK